MAGMMQPGRQPDGSWFVPLMPLRKDASIFTKSSKFGRARAKEYRQRQADFRSYLVGLAQREFIPREKQRNVKLDVVVYHDGYSAMDAITAVDFLQDVLEGIAYENDWQVCGGSFDDRLYSGQTGVWFRITRI